MFCIKLSIFCTGVKLMGFNFEKITSEAELKTNTLPDTSLW